MDLDDLALSYEVHILKTKGDSWTDTMDTRPAAPFVGLRRIPGAPHTAFVSADLASGVILKPCFVVDQGSSLSKPSWGCLDSPFR